MMFCRIISALAAITSVSAANILVQVGANNGLTYNPSSVNASVGDTIAFQFLAKNHSVTQSTFASPCNSSGVDSGFFPVTANASEVPQWSFTVNNASAPLWFFCAQTGHCAKGMVFAVNANAAKSFEAFQAAAMATGGNTTTGTGTSGTGATGTGAVSPSGSVVQSGVGASPSPTASSALSKLSFSSASAALAVVGLVAGCIM
ncbi:uncharacterized protein FOMMEDRAFT_139054 [Fomitiporia mediterranea MF3/22]|uniref:uncharacterized protein n=1 Tax=Fomitiporia mediterranea (strain MF3/22) TaxID=694068 RepID=UPI000440812F|nr:uncharacterized protein FOMMEDRAFT_139054 [Fomitiporia mediterranea MF3/22]EJD05686.1 hypothetical protein FOMMEDRAFT_139054 [Fomitiporia mediterranea MF3/22]